MRTGLRNMLLAFGDGSPAADSAERESAGSDLACPTCGYCLRGLPNCVCPECGRTFDVEALRRSSRPRPRGVVLDVMGMVFAIITVIWSCVLADDLIRRAVFRAGQRYSTHAYHGIDTDRDAVLYLVLAPVFVILAFAFSSRWAARVARIAFLSVAVLIITVWITVDRVT